MKQLINIVLGALFCGIAYLINLNFNFSNLAILLYVTLAFSVIVGYNLINANKKTGLIMLSAIIVGSAINYSSISSLKIKELSLFLGILSMFLRLFFQNYILITKESIVKTDRETSVCISVYTALISIESLFMYGYFMMNLFFEDISIVNLFKVGIVCLIYILFQNIRKIPED